MLCISRYKEIYSLLDTVSPAPFDCGKLCGGICCSDEPFGNGKSYIYLLPGEKEYLESEGCGIRIRKQRRYGHDLPISWGRYVYIALCPGESMCDRRLRPIQCRTFPLKPYIERDGTLKMLLYYDDIPYACPFVTGDTRVSDDFVRVTLEAWSYLVEDKAIRDMIERDSALFRDAENGCVTDL